MSDREAFWNAFKQISDHAGLFIVRGNPNKRRQQKIFQGCCVIFYSMVTVILFHATFQEEDGLVVRVVNGLFILMTIVIFAIIWELVNNEEAIHDLLVWCTERGHQKFNQTLQPMAGNRFNFSRKICSRLLLFNSYFFMILGMSLTIVVGGVMQLFPSLRYKLPIPYHLPVENWQTLKIFLLTLVIQSISVFIMSQTISFFVSLIMVFFIQVYTYLKITIDGISAFKQQLEDPKMRTKVNIDDKLKIFIKMILSVIRIMSSFTKMMRNIVMSLEIVSFFSILINACIVLIEKQKEHYLIGTAILMFNVIALGIALVNDLLKDKIHQVMMALYDLPWDEFTPKQRILIRFAMYCVNINTQFKSSTMNEFNLERFSDITKTAYSNTLVLKKMIEKSIA